jgi:hypothetical protein
MEIKTKIHKVVRNEVIQAQIMMLARMYSLWLDLQYDWNTLEKEFVDTYEKHGENALFDLFNQTFKPWAQIEWEEECQS